MVESYQVCIRCVMDSTDPGIGFDSSGICSRCQEFYDVTRKGWFPNEEGARRLKIMIEEIQLTGKGRPYDCILGLSGGVDSSYVALKAKEWGLRPLVVHVDGGWDREMAVENVQRVVKYCDFELFTHVVDWDEMRDLQLAYLRAGVANQDVLEDHVFNATLYHHAARNKIRVILSGGNIATEGIGPRWMYNPMDSINIRAINRQYGTSQLRAFTTIGFFRYYIWYPLAKGIRIVRPLNFIPYSMEKAIAELQATVGWRFYGRKHGESLFTKLFQNYYLPTRFGYDKRRPHLSSLIVSGQMSRDEALCRLQEPLYKQDELESDIALVCKRLRITHSDFDALMAAPIHQFSDFANQDRFFRWMKYVQRLLERATGRRLRIYS